MDGVTFKSLLEENNLSLVVFFSKKEIKEVVWDCDDNKSPKLDGFNFNFNKSCWNVLKVDIVRVVQKFHSHGRLPRGSNSSFLLSFQKKRIHKGCGSIGLFL